MKCTRHTFVQQYNQIMDGGMNLDPVQAGTLIQPNQQLLVCAPTNNKIRANVKGLGKVRVIAMKKDTFPLQMTTDILGASEYKEGETELVIASPGPKGCILYIIGQGKVEVNVDSDGFMLLEVATTFEGKKPEIQQQSSQT